MVNMTLVEPGMCSVQETFGCSLSAIGQKDSAESIISVEARTQNEFRPRIVSVETTKPGAQSPYGTGEPIDIVVSFNYPVQVSSNGSAPALRMNTGSYAIYGYGSGTHNLTFWYVVGDGDNTEQLETFSNGYAFAFDPGEVNLTPLDTFFLGQPEGWIRRLSSNSRTPADLTMPLPGDPGSLTVFQTKKSSKLRVCTSLCARIELVTSTLPSKSKLGAGAKLPIIIHFNRPVLVNLTGGYPYIELQLGHSSNHRSIAVAQAGYVNGSGGQDLLFVYTVQEGDLLTNPVVIHQRSSDTSYTTTAQLSGGSITTVSTGKEASLTLTRIGRQKARSLSLNLHSTIHLSPIRQEFLDYVDPSWSLRDLNIIIDTRPPSVHTVTATVHNSSKIYG